MKEDKVDTKKGDISLEEKLQDRMARWTGYIKDMESKMTNIGDLQNLLNIVYLKRQELTEEIQNLRFATAKLSRMVKQHHTQKYQEYKMNSQLRYTSDAAINNQIEVDLNEMYEKLDFMKVHTDMMAETLRTVDDVIYGIKERVELHKILNGLKF